jgi:AmpE protein
MNLISILAGLAMEYFLGPLDRFRDSAWFESYLNWLEQTCRRSPMWDGPVGVILTLALPVTALLLVSWLLGEISIVLPFLLAILVFVYSLGPNIDTRLNNYIQAIEGNMVEDIAVIEGSLNLKSDNQHYQGAQIIPVALLRAHDSIFGVIFWFVVLGMSGALLFCLTLLLKRKFEGIRSGYAIAVDELHNILIWPSTRLLAIGFALSGSLVDTLEAWRKVEGDTFNCSQQVMIMAGLGALQYAEETAEDDESARARYVQWIREAQALINRTLVIWLTALGILTLGHILS